MEPRLGWAKTDIEAHRALQGIETYLKGTGLDGILIELVKVRTSQINGCAYCIDVHVRVARELGETDRRLHLLNAWRESPFFTDRERAALEWTEALTLISENDVPDSLYENVRKFFNEKEIVALSMAIVAINGWNRLAISFRTVPGSYNPA